MTSVEQIERLLVECTQEQRLEIFRRLRKEFPIHSIESEWNVQAELILEAIDRANDITKRGIRGVIAEAAFELYVLKDLPGWKIDTQPSNSPFDFSLSNNNATLRIQVKMQRLLAHQPMLAKRAYSGFSSNMFVVETQKTRGGIDSRTGENTRPYRFGEFDILAVSMHPSTKDWSTFRYTVANWLIPQDVNKQLIFKFQPIPFQTNNDWTDDLQTCINWLRLGEKKTILGNSSN